MSMPAGELASIENVRPRIADSIVEFFAEGQPFDRRAAASGRSDHVGI